jgi:alpha-beta hydrolase superfamily lysophospholipase
MSEQILHLKPKNWQEHQHYKDRLPPWIKLHRALLNDKQFMRLPVASKALAPLLWLLASESQEGVFNASTDELEFRLRMTAKEIDSGLKPLIDIGFFHVASGVLADRLQVAAPEQRQRREETETEDRSQDEGFNQFYQLYPKRVAKPAALKAWRSQKVKQEEVQAILKDVAAKKNSADWKKEEGKFVPMPSTYLNQRRWEDQPAQVINIMRGVL